MIEKIKKDLLENISKDRYEHTLRVVETCQDLAELYGVDLEKTKLAALLHDSARFTSKEKMYRMAEKLDILKDENLVYNSSLIHGPLAAIISKNKYVIVDEDILNAIKYHTTGRPNMSLLEKIIFIGDYIEPNRSFRGIENIRTLAYEDLDKSILLALNTSLKFLIKKDKLISTYSIEARNYLMIENIKERELFK